MNKTCLHTDHLALGAKMGPFAGYDMPLQYSGVKAEVQAVRNNAGMFDVSHMGEFWVEGPEAETFVDELITNDFKSAAVGKAVYSPLCRENGTVIDDLIAYKIEKERILICVNASNIEKDWNWIEAQSKGRQITLTNKSAETSLLAIQGPKAAEIMASSGINTDVVTYAAIETDSAFGQILMARTGYTGEDGFEVFGTHEQIQQLWRALIQKGVTPCGLAARDVLRLEACYPLYGHELSDEWTPLDANLKWTVKLNKAKFIGLEALKDYKPRYKMIKLLLDRGIPREGYRVKSLEGTDLGHVSSGTMSVVLNKGIALALIDAKTPATAGTKVNVVIRNTDYEAVIVKDAFLKGGQ